MRKSTFPPLKDPYQCLTRHPYSRDFLKSSHSNSFYMYPRISTSTPTPSPSCPARNGSKFINIREHKFSDKYKSATKKFSFRINLRPTTEKATISTIFHFSFSSRFSRLSTRIENFQIDLAQDLEKYTYYILHIVFLSIIFQVLNTNIREIHTRRNRMIQDLRNLFMTLAVSLFFGIMITIIKITENYDVKFVE